jgi:hypothetical protein
VPVARPLTRPDSHINDLTYHGAARANPDVGDPAETCFAAPPRDHDRAAGCMPSSQAPNGWHNFCAPTSMAGAQVVRAPDCGSGGRWFNSPQLYQFTINDLGAAWITGGQLES